MNIVKAGKAAGYDYSAKVVRVIDGDTIVLDLILEVDIGFSIRTTFVAQQRIRLARVNCPESSSDAGVESSAFTQS